MQTPCVGIWLKHKILISRYFSSQKNVTVVSFSSLHLTGQVVAETVPDKKVWLGETSSAYGGGAPRLSNTYIAGFM